MFLKKNPIELKITKSKIVIEYLYNLHTSWFPQTKIANHTIPLTKSMEKY